MLDEPVVSEFSHVKPGDTAFVGQGLRDFFLYRDLGIAAATGGRVLAQLVKASRQPEHGTGWHRHEADFHIVLMLKGWARFMYEGKETLVAAGDCVHQRPGDGVGSGMVQTGSTSTVRKSAGDTISRYSMSGE